MQWREGRLEQGVGGFDEGRAGRLAVWRAIQAPMVDAAWRTFDAQLIVHGGALAGGIRGAAARAFLDQLLIAPPSLVCFFGFLGAMEGCTLDECVGRITAGFWPAYMVALPFWGGVHLVTFGFMPPDFRIAWASVVAVAWNAFMSGQVSG